MPIDLDHLIRRGKIHNRLRVVVPGFGGSPELLSIAPGPSLSSVVPVAVDYAPIWRNCEPSLALVVHIPHAITSPSAAGSRSIRMVGPPALLFAGKAAGTWSASW